MPSGHDGGGGLKQEGVGRQKPNQFSALLCKYNLKMTHSVPFLTEEEANQFREGGKCPEIDNNH